MTPEEMLRIGLDDIQTNTKADIRWNYYIGDNDRPFAPPGVNTEYEALRRQSATPLVRLAVRTPVQRLRVGGIRTDSLGSNDKATWDVWKANRLGSQQRIIYVHGLVYGYAIVSIWPNKADKSKPLIMVEDPNKVYFHRSTINPLQLDFVVKTWTEREATPNDEGLEVAYVYTAQRIYRYTAVGGSTAFELAATMVNPMGVVPFEVFTPERDATGATNSMVDALIPIQRAIDTMRFNLLLAAQYAAFKQRIIVGFDPVQRDDEGNVVFAKNEDGTLKTDGAGNPIPILTSPGVAGVDRFLVFAGSETKVFEMQESDLKNYVVALNHLIAQFASVAQVPPQYLVSDFSNVSGDLMVATEATLRSFIADLQVSFNDGWTGVFEKASIAAGQDFATEVVWSDAEPKSLTQIADAASKMVPQGAPLRMFLEMIPNISQSEVDRLMGQSQDALNRALGGDLATSFGPKPELEA